MTRRVLGVCAAGLVYGLVSCNDSSPVAPTAPEPPAAPAPVPTNIMLTATPTSLPANGGTAAIGIRVIASGGVGVPGVVVKLSGLDGEVDAAEVTMNGSGEGSAQWTARTSGTVVARAGMLTSSVTIPVIAAPPPVTPPRPPAPAPAPTPIPEPTPDPFPEAVLTATMTVDDPPPVGFAFVREDVMHRVQVSGFTHGDTVIAYKWDWNNDGDFEATSVNPVFRHEYTTHGVKTPSVTVVTNHGKTAKATGRVVVISP